jgi:acyl carrier protein
VKKERTEIAADITALLQKLAEDWDYSEAISEETLLFSELRLESLGAVVLGTTLQDRYDFTMPFAELLASLGEREVQDLSVGELIDFVDRHLNSTTASA